jgi:hypothetical protein
MNMASMSFGINQVIITPEEAPPSGETSFDLTITSRTERVYTRTFVLVIEEEK